MYRSTCGLGHSNNLTWVYILDSLDLSFYPFGASDAQVIAMIVCLSVCVCVCVTRRYCIKMAKHRITQTTARDSPGTLVF